MRIDWRYFDAIAVKCSVEPSAEMAITSDSRDGVAYQQSGPWILIYGFPLYESDELFMGPELGAWCLDVMRIDMCRG